MKNIFVLLLLVTVSAFSFGETMEIDLEGAINMAFENSYTVKNEDIDLKNSALQIREAYKEALPKISYTGTYSKNEENIYGEDIYRDSNYKNVIGLVQPLYRGGVIGAGIEASKKIKERSEYEFLKTKGELRLLVIEKYLNILKLKRELAVYKTSLEDVEGQYKKAKRKYELRLISRADVLPFATRVINIRTNIIKTQNNMDITEVELKNEIGLEDSDIKLKIVPLDFKKHNLLLINIESDIREAREKNRDSKISQLDYQLVKANEALAKSEFFPKVDFNFAYTGEEGNFQDSTEEWQWSTGVTINMNLFEFGQNIDTYKRYKNETEKYKNLERKTKNDIEVTIRSNYLNLLGLDGMVEEQKSAVEFSKENYDIEKRRYEKGLVSVIDLLQIERILRESELNLLQAELDYYLAYETYIDYLK
jgi:outer membrane protein TolC